MTRNSSLSTPREAQPSAPTEAWLFARAILGRPVPDPRRAAWQAQTERDELERLAPFVPRCAERLRELEGAEALVRRSRESLAWAAGISHEAKLRGNLREEAAAAEAQQRWERHFEAQWAAVSEQRPWREEDHPRAAAGTPEGGQWVEKGAGGGVGSGGDVPQSRRRTRAQFASQKAPESETFWKGAINVAGNLDLPTGLLLWNASNKTAIKQGAKPSFRGGLMRATVTLDQLAITRLQRVGKAGRFNPATDNAVMGSLYNEAFHAWFWGNRKSLGWLLDMIMSHEQFGDPVAVKAEEAMSECIHQVINELQTPRQILSYDELMQLKPSDSRRQNLTPGHNDPGEKWEGDAGSRKAMSEELYYATIWVMYNGKRDPAPGGGNRLTAMKEFFAQKFHPDWMPDEVQQFADSRYGEE